MPEWIEPPAEPPPRCPRCTIAGVPTDPAAPLCDMHRDYLHDNVAADIAHLTHILGQ